MKHPEHKCLAWNRGEMSMLVAYVFLASFATGLEIKEDDTNYLIGAGIADMTGPAAQVNLMGYANPAQTAGGLHLRQYSRAFIIADTETKSPIVFVSTDSCMQSQGLKLEVVRRLKALYGDLYNERNLCISGTHTHSGPGGFHQYLLYDITSLGFVNETLIAFADGIVRSIQRAHDSIKPGNMYINTKELLNSNINRSPTAYLLNPAEERAKYKYDVDKNMTVVKMVDATGKDIGMISWFAVHCTSMNNTNKMISSDNKGYASQLMEEAFAPGFPGNGKFIAAFAQSNLGDVSPNTKGPHCLDTGLPCDENSTCNGRNEKCVAFGPGNNMMESTQIIGKNQFEAAMDLYKTATVKLSGPVKFQHTYVNMSNVKVQLNSTNYAYTCLPAMGYSFAAGTTDGPGMFDFTQGDDTGNPFWNFVSSILHNASTAQRNCHHPKPILLDTGEISWPWAWQPVVVDVQLMTIGQLAIISVPAEFTTMSGRRTRDRVTEALISGGFPQDTVAVVAGLSNDYADYVTTFEEYQKQRYEGASTIYGPYTLNAYIQELVMLAGHLTRGTVAPKGPNPPNLLSQQVGFLPPVVFDYPGFAMTFGEVIETPKESYKQGDTVEAVFVGANPRNNRRQEGTFLTVEQKQADGNWTVEYKDSHWCTEFHWELTNLVEGQSEVTIIWNIPQDQTTGTYRINYYGDVKHITGGILPFSGTTPEFRVVTSELSL